MAMAKNTQYIIIGGLVVAGAAAAIIYWFTKPEPTGSGLIGVYDVSGAPVPYEKRCGETAGTFTVTLYVDGAPYCLWDPIVAGTHTFEYKVMEGVTTIGTQSLVVNVLDGQIAKLSAGVSWSSPLTLIGYQPY